MKVLHFARRTPAQRRVAMPQVKHTSLTGHGPPSAWPLRIPQLLSLHTALRTVALVQNILLHVRETMAL